MEKYQILDQIKSLIYNPLKDKILNEYQLIYVTSLSFIDNHAVVDIAIHNDHPYCSNYVVMYNIEFTLYHNDLRIQCNKTFQDPISIRKQNLNSIYIFNIINSKFDKDLEKNKSIFINDLLLDMKNSYLFNASHNYEMYKASFT